MKYLTKEELEKEAYQFLIQATKDKKLFYFGGNLEEILAEFAEPREKQIEIDAKQIRALQKQNGELTDELTKKADTNHQLVEQMAKLSEKNAELEDKLANADYQLEGRDNEITELKEQNKELAKDLAIHCQDTQKVINEYEEENTGLKSELNRVRLNEQLAINNGRNLLKHITELNVQIEKMVNEIDKTMVLSNMRECEICDIQDIFRKYGFKRNSNDIWEIKEK